MTVPVLPGEEEGLVPCYRTVPGGRLLHLTFAGMASLTDVTAYVGASYLPGCSLDAGVTVNGHQTLRYDPELAGGPAQLGTYLTGGYSRLWSRVLFRPAATLYSGGEPAPGVGAVPLTLTAQGGSWAASAGLYRPVAAGDYRPLARVAGAATLEATGTRTADPSTAVAGLQALGWTEWVTLTEKWHGGARIRLRAWQAGVLVLDRQLPIATPMLDFWLTALVALDPGRYEASNELHIGEWTLWDAEASPDPYGLLLFWADSYEDFVTDTFIGGDPKYRYGLDLPAGEDTQGRGGRNMLYTGWVGAIADKASFLGHDLPVGVEEWEVTQQFWFRFWGTLPDVPVMLCAWMSARATAIGDSDPFFPRHGNNTEHASLWWLPATGQLELRTAAGGIFTGPVGVDAFTPDPFAPTARAALVWVSATLFVHPTAGSCSILIGNLATAGVGVVTPYLLVENINTADGPGGIVSLVLGHREEVIGPDVGSLNYCGGWLLTRGAVYRLHECCFLQPNGDAEQDSQWSRDDGWIQFVFTPSPLGWYLVSTDLAFEPDDLSSYVFTNTSLAAGAVYGFHLTACPDPVCGGVIAGVVPALNVGQSEDDGAAAASCYLYVKPGAVRYRTALIGSGSDVIWKPDHATTGGNLQPPSDTGQPYRGENGCQTFQPTVFPVNPDTGDAWDPAGPMPIVGVEAQSGLLQVTHLGAHLVRVRPSLEVPVPGGEWPHTIGSYRPTLFRHPHGIGSYRQTTLAKWVHAAGSFRPVAAGAFPCPLYCPVGPSVRTVFRDGFDGPRLTRKPWGYAFTWGNGHILLVDGRLRLRGPNAPIASGPADVGPFSQGAYDLRGGYVQVELVTRPQLHPAHMMMLYFSNTWLRWRNGMLEFGFGTGNHPGTILGSDPSGGIGFYRIRHDPAAPGGPTVYGEFSLVGFAGPWDVVGSVVVGPTAFRFSYFGLSHTGWGIGGGTYVAASIGEFDNFEAGFWGHL